MEGRPRERSTRRWRRRRSDAGAGDGAAAAEQQHLRDPGCSVPVARGPAERRETTRPTGKVRPGGTRTSSGTTGVILSSYEAFSDKGARPGHSDKGVWDPDRESGRTVRLMLAPVPLMLMRSPLRADRL